MSIKPFDDSVEYCDKGYPIYKIKQFKEMEFDLFSNDYFTHCMNTKEVASVIYGLVCDLQLALTPFQLWCVEKTIGRKTTYDFKAKINPYFFGKISITNEMINKDIEKEVNVIRNNIMEALHD